MLNHLLQNDYKYNSSLVAWHRYQNVELKIYLFFHRLTIPITSVCKYTVYLSIFLMETIWNIHTDKSKVDRWNIIKRERKALAKQNSLDMLSRLNKSSWIMMTGGDLHILWSCETN